MIEFHGPSLDCIFGENKSYLKTPKLLILFLLTAVVLSSLTGCKLFKKPCGCNDFGQVEIHPLDSTQTVLEQSKELYGLGTP